MEIIRVTLLILWTFFSESSFSTIIGNVSGGLEDEVSTYRDDNCSLSVFNNCIKAPSECITPPKECPNSNITFYLYTNESRDNPHQLDVASFDTIKSAIFKKGKPVKFIIHGYTGHKNFAPNPELRPAYLNLGDINVISIDYGPLARDGCYIQAAYNVDLVGNCSAQLLDALVREGKIRLEDIHVIGFSLGGQVAGQIGNYIKSGQLPRITGLDPAAPLFYFYTSNEKKLDSTDAIFVDVIHTNAGVNGKVEQSGHVDFYVNGGASQPGCSSVNAQKSNSCSHNRAPTYFTESINSTRGFWGYPCSNLYFCAVGWTSTSNPDYMVLMGENVSHSARGSYYLVTNSEPEYAKGRNI